MGRAVLLLAMFAAACYQGPTEPEPVCTTYIVSAITGDTIEIENYQGPPSPDSLFHVVEWWTEGCEEEQAQAVAVATDLRRDVSQVPPHPLATLEGSVRVGWIRAEGPERLVVDLNQLLRDGGRQTLASPLRVEPDLPPELLTRSIDIPRLNERRHVVVDLHQTITRTSLRLHYRLPQLDSQDPSYTGILGGAGVANA